MSVSRIVKPWSRHRAGGSRRQALRACALVLEPLENRMALAAGLQLSLVSLAEQIAPANETPSWEIRLRGPDAWSDASPHAAESENGVNDTGLAAGHANVPVSVELITPRFGAAHGNSSSAFSGGDASSSLSSDATPPAGQAGAVVALAPVIGPVPTNDSGQDPGGPPTTNEGAGGSQGDSGGGTNSSSEPPPGSGDAPGPSPADPSGQIFATGSAETEDNLGLLDPLAWTVDDGELSGEVTEAFDGEDPLLLNSPAVAAGPSTLMGRPDELAVGGVSDYRSIAMWRADSYELLQSGDNKLLGVRHSIKFESRDESIAAGAAPWRGLLNGWGPSVESGASDHEHIAELSPLAGSIPLALAATLWSTPVRSSAPGQEEAGSTALQASLDVEQSRSTWKIVVMGLERAFDQSYAEVQQGLAAEAAGGRAGDGRYHSAVLEPEWRGAILPTASVAARASNSERLSSGGAQPGTGAGDSFVAALIQLGEFFFENLLDPVLGHENGGNGDSQ